MIIGLMGYAQSGKDSVAKVLVERYGYTRLAFADNIRNMLFDINPLVKDNLRIKEVIVEYGWEQSKSLFPEVRDLLQRLGVSARTHLDNLIWIAAVMGQIQDGKN
jgi:hypothetical protein